MDAIHQVPWAPADQASPTELEDGRLQAHWAAQIIAPVGAQFVEPVSDYGHTALTWSEVLGAFVTRAARVPGDPNGGVFHAALRLVDLTVLLLDAGQNPVRSLALEDRTLDEGLRWLAQAIGAHTETASAPLERVGYTMQSHPVMTGARFRVARAHLAALDHWYRNAAHMLEAVRSSTPEAHEVRTWPHHFDMATLATFDGPEVEAEAARSLGFGLSPGDETYRQPYWYVLPWPSPAADRLKRLPVGHWHTDGFVGAVLTGLHDATAVADFFRSADQIGRGAIGVANRDVG